MTTREDATIERLLRVARKLLEPVKGRATTEHAAGAPIDDAERAEETAILRAEIAARLAEGTGGIEDRARRAGPAAIQPALERAIARRRERAGERVHPEHPRPPGMPLPPGRGPGG